MSGFPPIQLAENSQGSLEEPHADREISHALARTLIVNGGTLHVSNLTAMCRASVPVVRVVHLLSGSFPVPNKFSASQQPRTRASDKGLQFLCAQVPDTTFFKDGARHPLRASLLQACNVHGVLWCTVQALLARQPSDVRFRHVSPDWLG
jgi:hypothetical protein